MATFLLIRDASLSTGEELVLGRASNAGLGDEGRIEARRLAERLARVQVLAVYSSPLERARETAEPLALKHRLDVRVRDALADLDFGEWSGHAVAALEEVSRWHLYNLNRAGVRPPGGELLVEAQARMVGEITRLAAVHAGKTVAVVSHADPLRVLIGHFVGIPLELLSRIELSPASVTVLSITTAGAALSRLNDTGGLAIG